MKIRTDSCPSPGENTDNVLPGFINLSSRKRLSRMYLFFFIPVFLLMMVSCSERPNITIEGKIRNGEREFVYLDYLDINQTSAVDSVRIRKDDSFKFSFYSDEPGIYILRSEDGKIISLLPRPGEQLYVETELGSFNLGYTVAGSEESEYIRRLVEKLNDTRSRIKKLNTAYESLTNVTEEQAASYIQQLKAINKEQRDFSIQFIIEHLSSLASVYALYQEVSDGQYVLGENYDIQYMKIVADSVEKYYPDVPFVKSFVSDARNSEKKVKNLNALQSKMKEATPTDLNIDLPDKSGKNILLSSTAGKTVLLYFWSTRSEDCKIINQGLKKTYQAYKGKGFEIYAVAIEETRKDWLNEIGYEELDWINVIEDSYPDSKTAALYNVRVLPSSFLINKNGDIVARNLFGTELEKWLDNIL